MAAARESGEPLPAHGDDAHDTDGELTVGRLAARVGLSRTTLLYYDRLGVLRPSHRSASGYRCYTADDAARLAQVCRLRALGIPLAAIGRLLDAAAPELVVALVARLRRLHDEIADLRAQQRAVLDALTRGGEGDRTWTLDRDALVALLDRAGVRGEATGAWHAAAEEADGARHQALLEALALPPADVARIRAAAARGAASAPRAAPTSAAPASAAPASAAEVP